jgi:hypothetical protein
MLPLCSIGFFKRLWSDLSAIVYFVWVTINRMAVARAFAVFAHITFNIFLFSQTFFCVNVSILSVWPVFSVYLSTGEAVGNE